MRQSHLIGRSFFQRPLHCLAVQSLVDYVSRLPCLQCGQAFAAIANVAPKRVGCGQMQLPLVCSKECADTLQATKPDKLSMYDSMVEDVKYSATPEASKLFAEVLQPSRRESNNYKGERPLRSWTDYLKLFRPDNRFLKDVRALRLLSSAYTFVMTISRFFPELIDPDQANNKDKFQIHVIGARAEATMPHYLWNELSFFHPQQQFWIKLIGDHVPRTASKTQMTNINSSIQLEMINGLYHTIEATHRENPSAFVLFNPGIGHLHLRANWEPTLLTILSSKRPILITSFSLEDQQRDLAVLQKIVASMFKQHKLRFRCQAKKNSFSSLKVQIDPRNVSTPIQTNSRVMVVQLATCMDENLCL
ncbi:hypothetical protein CCR75_004186 [Bremia lactucae]|uniref:Mitochondrial splicing suppressor 51-like C-terminal domain-containing protein n=1 Tax=Bremia lactucae TaxID=4779 RepID=A0A976FJD4_BRELC|nr:hypothetical protein CCR75_004186 [Bremia lactucae]